jgi:N-acetylneuraminate synthase/pseudaminic acid synthase
MKYPSLVSLIIQLGDNVEIKIGKCIVSANSPTFIIAEMSGNHGGKIENAIKIVHHAKKVGADALKLQTYRPDTITLDSDAEDFRIPGDSPWKDSGNLFNLYKQAYTPWEWHAEIFAEARKLGMEIFSSPFDFTAIDLLEKLGAPAYKIASPEITDIPLIKRAAETGKPVIMSTGLATLEDTELAVETVRKTGNKQLILLKCTSAYPTPLDQANLANIPDLAKRFNCIVGLSDHTEGTLVPVVAVAMGAKVVEKHFTLSEIGNTVDSFFSLDQDDFGKMVTDIRNTEKAIGKISYEIAPAAKVSLLGRRSLYVAKDIKKGEKLTPENVRSVRPSLGLHPKYYYEVLNGTAKRDLKFGDRLTLDAVEMK